MMLIEVHNNNNNYKKILKKVQLLNFSMLRGVIKLDNFLKRKKFKQFK